MLPPSSDICLQKVVICYIAISKLETLWKVMMCSTVNKNTCGVKNCEANQKQHASRQVQPKVLISAEAKKLLYQNSLNNIQ